MKIPFYIRLFGCDAPARSFISEVMSIVSIKNCSKCDQKVTRLYYSELIYQSAVGTLRAGANFRERMVINHYHPQFPNIPTALEDAGIVIVSQLPIEPMH